jgi:hypothetical protein
VKYPAPILPLYPILGILFVAINLINAVEVSKRFKTVLDVHAASQTPTLVSESQLRLKVRVVEWQRCVYTSPDAKQSCVGLDLVRFLMSDGTIQGPYFLLPPPANYAHDPAKWVAASEFTR